MSVLKLLKEKLNEQLKHLQKMEKVEPETFKGMVSGAQTCMCIVEDYLHTNSGTDGYLKQLDQQQLVYAQESCKRLLQAKEQEVKTVLYGVENELTFTLWFDNYQAAIEMFALLAVLSSKNEKQLNKQRRFTMEIQKTFVIESEVKEYLCDENNRKIAYYLNLNPENDIKPPKI